MKKIVFAIVSSCAISSASAADTLIPVKAPQPPQYYDWSGIYVGANGGRAWNRTQGTVSNFANDLTDQKLNGWLGGAQVGVNHQIGRVVLGLELSGAWANAKDTSDCGVTHISPTLNLSCSAKQDWSAQLLARFGYAPGDGRFLPYILGGVGMAQLTTIKEVGSGGSGTPAVGQSTFAFGPAGSSAVHQGLVIGAGAQYAVSPWVSVGFDYLYGIYGTNEQGGVSSFRSVSNQQFGGLFVSTGSGLLISPQNLTTQTARFIINFKLD